MNVLADLAGDCAAMVALREKVREFSRRQSGVGRHPPVLIEGETGSGKGLLARFLHQSSSRSSGPFIEINCAAIPETLLETELFGYERGAFTDARHAKLGLFQAAHTGTLFLDEIGLLPASLQSKLLSVLEAGAVRPLGSTRSQPVNVWIIAATNEHLTEAVRTRRFREDLYHRIAVMMFSLPPLRERGHDVILLADRFLTDLCGSYSLPRKSFDEAALALLRAYNWPGNVRELSNTIERAVLLSDGSTISGDTLQLSPALTVTAPPPPALDAIGPGEAARLQLSEALAKTSWNISRTAALLGLTRNTVRARIERFGLVGPGGAARVRSSAVADSERAAAPSSTSRSAGHVRAAEPTAPRVSVRWDRRRVAFLRVALGESPPPEAAALEWSEPLKVILDKVRSFGGVIQEISLHSIEASFGLEPVEDPARRAAHAGLAIRRELAATPQNPPSRIAIHACEVLAIHAGDYARIDSESKRHVAPIVGALEAAATPGSIVASGSTAAFLRRRFALAPVSSAMPDLNPYVVLGHEQFNAGDPEKGTRFVGRDHELALLQARIDSVIAGRGQLVTVVGDPGMGKSRLVWEFAHGPETRAARILETGSAYAAITPYLPVIELLRRGLSIGPDDEGERLRERLDAVLGMRYERAKEWLSAIASLLGRPDAEWAALASVERRHRTLEVVKQLLLSESRLQPLVLVFEDIHWIDQESQAVLDALVQALPTARILLVVTYRSEYRHKWNHLNYLTQLSLGPLSSDSVNELLEDLLGKHPSLAPTKRQLIVWTDGNPLFVEESVQTLIETGALQGQRGGYQAIQSAPALPIPATIEEILASRIDRLPARDKVLLQGAAAIGAEVPMAVLSGIAGLGDSALRGGIQRLQAADLLYESVGSPSAGGGFAFKHALTREVAYRSLLPPARRDLHRKIVAILETMSSEGAEHIDRLGRHAFQGELWDKAVTYLMEAGDRAIGTAALREAAEYFTQALSALGHLPQTVETRTEAVDLRLRMRDALWPQLEFAALFDNLQRAEAIAADLGDRRRQGWIACYLCQYFWGVGHLEQAIVAGERAREIAIAIDNSALLAETNFYLGIVRLAGGALRRAVDLLYESLRELDKALAHARHEFASPRFAQAGPVLARGYLSSALSQIGEFSEAIACGEQALTLAKASGSPFELAAASGTLGGAYVRKGDLNRAVQILEPNLVRCRTYRLHQWGAPTAAFLGSAYVQLGRFTDAIVLLEDCVNRNERLGLGANASVALTRLGEAYLAAGRWQEAASAAQRALALCRDRRERGSEGWALFLLAEIAEQGGLADGGAAEARYEEALSLAREHDMRPLVGRCERALARLRADSGSAVGRVEAGRQRQHLDIGSEARPG